MNATGIVTRDHHETADEYARVIARPADGWRVVECRDGVQWILQRRKGGGGEWPWRAVRYHRGRDALLRSTGALCEACDPAALAILAALPECIGIRRKVAGGAQ